MRSRTFWLSAAIVATASISASLALGRPPAPESNDTGARPDPLVGRVQLRDGTYDLTLRSLHADGPTRELLRGLAGIHADLTIETVREAPAEQAASAPPAGSR